MLSMLRGKKGKKGFTLIELMIVVAIIGILAAIAIPNFLRFQAKSKQSEAKTNLGGIYTAEVAYRAEHDAYADLNVISWAPSGTPRYRYTLSPGGSNDLGNVANVTFGTWGTSPFPGAGTPTPLITNTTPGSFTAGAQGNVDTDATMDAWFINDARLLGNSYDDVTL